MWFETLTSLELDRLIEFEATHGRAVKGARLIMNLRVPGFEQARKSSEDTHFTGYARFEKVWAR